MDGLFYRNGDALMAVDVTMSPALKIGAPRRLSKNATRRASLFPNYSATADGQRFLMIKRIDQGESPTEIGVAINWFEELKRATTEIGTLARHRRLRATTTTGITAGDAPPPPDADDPEDRRTGRSGRIRRRTIEVRPTTTGG
jgi:hypothetical protein